VAKSSQSGAAHQTIWRRVFKRRVLLTPLGLALTVPLTVIYLLETLVLKGLQLHAIVGSLPLLSLIQVIAPDIAWLMGAGTLAAILISISRPWLSATVGVLFFIFMGIMLTMGVANYGFFLSVGANLSWSSIQYWMVNYEQVSKVISHESNITLRFILSYSQFAIVIVAAVVPLVPAIRRRVMAATIAPRTSQVSVAGAAAIVLMLSFVPRGEGELTALCQCVPVNIMGDFVADVLIPEEEVVIAESERLDASLELKAKNGAPRYNVVFFIFESLNWKSSDVYIPGLGTTPFLEQMASQGQIIENQYTVVPHTTKAVVPLNCGIYPYLDTKPIETTPGILPRRCLAHILRSQGYQTAFFQPAANFEERHQLVANMGYDVYRGLNDLPQEGFEETNYFGREERMMLEPSLEWVDSARKEGPFLLTYLTLSTHHNYVTPQSFPYVEYDVEDVDQRNYYNAVRYIDTFLKEVHDEFDKRGLLDSTLFVIIGDHGEAFGEHGGRQHDLIMWEEGLRSFGMLYAPGILEPGRITGARSHLDIVPTVVDFLGLELTRGSFVGTSLLKPVDEDRVLYHSCWFRRRCLAMHDGMLKTIFHYGLRQDEAYDNAMDQFDEFNLAHQGDYDEEFLSAREAEMKRWVKVVNQQYKEWEEALKDNAISETEPPIANRASARFGDAVELVGYEVQPQIVEAGRDFRVKYVFRALRELESTDSLFVHVLHRGKFLNEDHVPAHGAFPLNKWPEGSYIIDEHTVHVPGTWKSGDARLAIGFWSKETKRRYEVTSGDLEVDDKRLIVANLKVRGSAKRTAMSVEQRREKIRQWIGTARPEVQQQSGLRFGEHVELVGYDLIRMDVELAGTVEITYAFKALKDIPSNWKFTVKLVRDDGVTINGDHIPIGGLYPPGDWQPNEYVIDRHRIHIDMHRSKPGTYGVYLGFAAGGKPVSPSGGELDERQRVLIGTVTISPTTLQ
jgi:lipoteichoic acid synthase